MEVGLEHVRDLDALLLREGEHPVDVTLRVDDQRRRAVVGQVAAVSEGGGLDGDDLRHGQPRSRPVTTSCPAWIQPEVPPSTL